MGVEILEAIYTGAGLATAANNIIRVPLPAGTLTGVRVKLNGGVTDGDAIFNLAINGTEIFTSELTVPDGDDEIDVTGLSTVTTNDDLAALNINAPFPTALPDPPISLYLTIDLGTASDATDIAAAIH